MNDVASRIMALAYQVDAIGQNLRRAKLSDDEAIAIAPMYPEWDANVHYEIDEIVRTEEGLWRCEQAHDAQELYKPSADTASLWTPIGFTPGGIEEWRQPTGAHDAYKKDAIVSYNGKTWKSTVDGNVWVPGVYGWEEVKE